jgi:hypothetical protein
MSHVRSITDLEADIVALRAAAERAGTALACLFSSADEFEAEVVRVRREQGAFRPRKGPRYLMRGVAVIALVALVFILF